MKDLAALCAHSCAPIAAEPAEQAAVRGAAAGPGGAWGRGGMEGETKVFLTRSN